MYRQIITPIGTQFMLQLPPEFVGHQMEVIAFPVDENKKTNKEIAAHSISDNLELRKMTDKDIRAFLN